MTLKGLGSRLMAILLATTLPGAAVAEPVPVEKIREAVNGNVDAAITLYREFLGLPNDAQYPDDIESLLAWMERAFAERGFETLRVSTAGNPFLFAGRHIDYDRKTLLVYLQADGQR